MTTSLANNNSHLNGLTWLRAIAAILVIFSHVTRAMESSYSGFQSTSVPNWVYAFDLGTFGVLLFFTLSGTTLYISSANSNIKTFFIKRFFRIWPAFAFALLCYILFRDTFTNFYPQLSGNWVEKQFTESYSVLHIVQYLTLTSNIGAPSGLFNNAFWSLPVEFQYYLCFPVIALLIKRFGVLGAVGFGFALYAIYKFKISSFEDTKVFMLGFSFCFGVAIGYLYTNNRLPTIKFNGGLLLFAVFTVAALITNSPQILPDVPVISSLWNNYIVLASLAVVIVIVNEPKIPKVLLPTLIKLGDVSYSLYLIHNLVIASLLIVFLQINFIDGSLPFYTMLLLSLLLTTILSLVMYKHIEMPGIRLGKKLGKKVA